MQTLNWDTARVTCERVGSQTCLTHNIVMTSWLLFVVSTYIMSDKLLHTWDLYFGQWCCCTERQITHSVTFCIMKFSFSSCRTQKSFSPFEYISVLIHVPLTRLLLHTDAASSESYQGSRLKQLKQMHFLIQSFLFCLGMRLGQFRKRLKSGAVNITVFPFVAVTV